MRIILLGAPGAGKGTQSTKILEKYSIPYISTGEYFRKEVASGSEDGEEIKRYIERGLLVPDHITIEIVKHILAKEEFKKNYLLDGFPRTVIQARMFDEIVKETKNPVQVVINLDIKEGLLIDRLTGREICRKCNAIYHRINKPSKVSGICDKCGSTLTQRADDILENVMIRLREYRNRTQPLIKYYRDKNLLVNIDASQDSNLVFQEICKVLEDLENDHNQE